MASGIYLDGLAKHSDVYTVEGTGEVYLTLPERIPFQNRNDTKIYQCSGSERLMDVAIAFYKDIYKNPVDLWEVIAQFQEEPITDPFVPLEQGRLLLIPSATYCESAMNGASLKDWPVL